MELRRRIMVNKGGLHPDSAPNGVYIQHANRQLYTRDKWNTAWNAKANGVAVLTDNCSFVISPIVSTSAMMWANSMSIVSDITTTTNLNIAKRDYTGSINTDRIITQLGFGNAQASEYCRRVVFKHGKNGYLGALGEWQEAYNNKAEINACMSLISGTAINAGGYHWASTQYDRTNSWLMRWYDSNVTNHDKTVEGSVRAFSDL